MATSFRIPTGWNAEERSFVLQLTNELDRLSAKVNTLELNKFDTGGKKLKIVAGVLRYPNPGTGWETISDATHTPINIKTVTSSATAVNIYYGFTARKVISLLATPDEYYSQMGVMCGASVGVSSAAIKFSLCTSPGYINPATLQSNNGNVWVFGIFQI